MKYTLWKQGPHLVPPGYACPSPDPEAPAPSLLGIGQRAPEGQQGLLSVLRNRVPGRVYILCEDLPLQESTPDCCSLNFCIIPKFIAKVLV